MALSLAVIASTWPIYGWVKQEYTPTDVDESEFEATINGPEGISIAAMDEAVRAIDTEIASVPGVQTVLITAGGSFLGRISQGNIYVRIAPHEERTFGARPALARDHPRRPDGRVPRQLLASATSCSRSASSMRKFRDFRILVRNIPGFNIGGGSFDIDFVLRGPDLEAARAVRRGAADARHRDGRHRRPRHDAAARPPELRVSIDRERAADLRRGHRADRHRAPAHGGRRHGGLALPRPHHQRGLLRPAPAEREGPRRSRRRSRASTSRGRTRGRAEHLVRLDNVVQIAPGFTASRIDRSDRQREVRLRAVVLARLRPGRPHRGAARRRRAR